MAIHGNTQLLIGKNAKLILSQKKTILKAISNEDYVRSHHQFLNASVGSHIRHSLDHFSKILYRNNLHSSGVPIIDYDTRQRNTSVQDDRSVGLKEVEKLMTLMDESDSFDYQLPVYVEHIGDSITGEKCRMSSSFGRELMFVSHHGLHHLFTIRLMMDSMAYPAGDAQLGVANSTLKHEHDNGIYR